MIFILNIILLQLRYFFTIIDILFYREIKFMIFPVHKILIKIGIINLDEL